MLAIPLIPLLGALFISSTTIKHIWSLKISLLTLLVALLLASNESNGSFSIAFILLTAFLTPVSIISTFSTVTKDVKTYYVSILVLESILIIVFISTTLIEFYCTFELSLVPLFILIVVFGAVNRYRAAFILFIYTLAGSLFILLAFIYIMIKSSGTSNIQVLSTLEGNIETLVFIGLFFSLAVKTPLVPFHVWLPRAHAEANIAGSILLAGIVLKLATYGYLRLLLPLIPYQVTYFSNIVLVLCLLGIVYTSISAIRITDLKGLVAVSSVAHISIVVIGLFSNSFEGIIGAIILSIAHGLISPAAFYSVGLLYNRFHTRQIYYYSGLLLTIPLFATILFLTCCGNIGVPISINFIGELIALIGVYELNPLIASLGASSILLSACYTLFIYNRITYGIYSRNLGYGIDLNRIELNILILLIVLTFVIGVLPNSVINYISYDVTACLMPYAASRTASVSELGRRGCFKRNCYCIQVRFLSFVSSSFSIMVVLSVSAWYVSVRICEWISAA